jgi:hypothetical protein
MKLLSTIWISSVLILLGCNKYLDVNPKSSLSDEQLFSSEIGFQQALSGVYSQLAARPLFGDNLSMGFASALAQNYTQSSTDRFGQTTTLNFTAAEVKNFSNATWSNAYMAIAGINHLLLNLEKNKAVLTDINYNLIKGEALALRAYTHFELLRLYGPAYVNDATKKAIPYETKGDAFANIPASSQEATSLALADLKEAETLLLPVDNILSGVNSRRYKMNYYAVKALEARILLYRDDKTGAAAAAKMVIESGHFPLIDPAQQATASNRKDRLFTPELVFALRNKNIRTWSELEYFKANGNSSLNRLTRSVAHIDAIYEKSTFDIRRSLLFENDGTILFPSKFWQTDTYRSDTNKVDQAIPLIRISELYYILAETAATPAEGAVYLNQVRKARALAELNTGTITAETLRAEITKEVNKEFYAESQTFYYYKRLDLTRIPGQVNNAYGRTVTAQSYILPIPDAELEFNPNY